MKLSILEASTAHIDPANVGRRSDVSDLGAVSSRKVIAFDSWTGGVSNIERLVGAFAQQGLDLFLVHIGSWGHDQDRPKEERIGELLVRDISYYGGASFKAILDREQPAAVLFLSTQAFAHRAFNRYCAQIGIPSVHLYHGLVNVQSTSAKRLNPLNLRSQLALAVSRLGKNLTLLWPVYAAALWRTSASPRDWLWFAFDVWRQVSGQAYSGPAAPDASTTACCVYAQADVSHAVKRYRLPLDKVFTVGNPDLVRFGLVSDQIGACLAPERTPQKTIMYIDTALIEAGAVFDGPDDFVEHVCRTHASLAAQGFDLVVKLHPAHSRTGVPELLRRHGIRLCDNHEFLSELMTCTAALSEPTSAAMIPLLLGLPLLLARYGKLANQEYGCVLTSYPRCGIVHSLEDIPDLLKRLVDIPPGVVQTNIEANAGPLPAADMPKRVAAAFAETMKKYPSSAVVTPSPSCAE